MNLLKRTAISLQLDTINFPANKLEKQTETVSTVVFVKRTRKSITVT